VGVTKKAARKTSKCLRVKITPQNGWSILFEESGAIEFLGIIYTKKLYTLTFQRH
jgi:hypothetical protein